jgi:hypothetical protein
MQLYADFLVCVLLTILLPVVLLSGAMVLMASVTLWKEFRE